MHDVLVAGHPVHVVVERASRALCEAARDNCISSLKYILQNGLYCSVYACHAEHSFNCLHVCLCACLSDHIN